MKKFCAFCAFYRDLDGARGDDASQGECRRYAPRPILYDCLRDTNGPHDGNDVAWPSVMAEDFCGEFAPDESAE